MEGNGKEEEEEAVGGEEEGVPGEDKGGGEQDEDDDDDDESDDEDGVQITIDHDKITDAVAKSSSYQQQQQSFGGLGKGVGPAGLRAPPGLGAEKKGRFTVEEFEQVGAINGTPAHEFDLEKLDDKPWKKPGERTD